MIDIDSSKAIFQKFERDVEDGFFEKNELDIKKINTIEILSIKTKLLPIVSEYIVLEKLKRMYITEEGQTELPEKIKVLYEKRVELLSTDTKTRKIYFFNQLELIKQNLKELGFDDSYSIYKICEEILKEDYEKHLKCVLSLTSF